MVKLNLKLLFIHYYIKKYKKSFCKKDCVLFLISLKTTKVCGAFLCCVFLIPYLFCSLSSFFYSDLNLVNEALSVTPLFVYDNIEDKKAQVAQLVERNVEGV
jgi:hypothetical protein